jgi:diguanylate cyclase (GGDEF)-like protein
MHLGARWAPRGVPVTAEGLLGGFRAGLPSGIIRGPHAKDILLTHDTVTVLLIGLDEGLATELSREEGFSVERAGDLGELGAVPPADAVVVTVDGNAPLETLGAIHAHLPDAAVLVVTLPGHDTDATVALHAGAEDALVEGSIPPGLLPRAVRYAVARRRLHRELATQDDATGLPNLRGFAPIAEHQLRMADRAKAPVVFVFVRLDKYVTITSTLGQERASDLAREASEVLLEAVRESDVPARIAADTFCVLLTGDAVGAETIVLSRLVEAIATHDARRDRPHELAISVGSALYDPAQPITLEQILETAGRRLRAHDSDAARRSSDPR